LWRGASCERRSIKLEERAHLVEESHLLEERRTLEEWRVHTWFEFLLEEGRI
jgi:hypothetical protein